jgi:hypothetical protein
MAMRRLRLALIKFGLGAFGRGHRIDDALDPADHFVLGTGRQLTGGLGKLGRQLVHQRTEATHCAHLADLRLEIVKVEALAGLELLGEGQRLLLVDTLLRFLDQRQHVAHTENA